MLFLYDPKFDMAITNSKETFNTFFTRFTSAIASLNFIDWHNILNFWRNFSK